MGEPVRVLVADDDAIVRDAYRAFLASQPDFSLVGEARTGREAIEGYASLSPDIVLMDLQMPGTSGIEAIREICVQWPDACVVALTTFGTPDYVVDALRSGAAGYLLKDAGGEALLSGMRQAVAGEMPLAPAVRRHLVSSLLSGVPTPATAPDPRLTPREVELLEWLAQGMTNQQIAGRMYISEGSVKQYLSHVGEKLGARSRTQILIRAIRLRVIDPHAAPSAGD
jgi:DNA-binding NarL/FixJ family response regulator